MTHQLAVCFTLAGSLFGWIMWTAVGGRFDRQVDSECWIVDFKWLTSTVRSTPELTEATIPEKIRSLDGRKVSLEGFVEPNNAGAVPMRSFTLVYNSYSPWGKPGPTEKVFGTASPGTKMTVTDSSREVRVVGTLHVGVRRNSKSGDVDSIFRIDADRIEPI